MIGGKLLSASAAVQPTFIEDVFSTYLYTGTGATQTITNGIDLVGEGGLVWFKNRTATTKYPQSPNHHLYDTARGVNTRLQTNETTGQTTEISGGIDTFNNNGFTLENSEFYDNQAGINYASWTFRKAPRFFDVVTWTGTGANRTIAHDLGVVPGCIIVKRTDTTGDWQVYHRGNTAAPETDYLVLNSTSQFVDDNTRWNDTLPTSTVFSLGTDATVNASGGTYVAYLFAHDPLGTSGDGSDGLIACGSYTGNGSTTGPVIDLGWEPQWLLVRKSDGVGNWQIVDNMRGMPVGSADATLQANLSGAEITTADYVSPNSTGFQVVSTNSTVNTSGSTYIYIAIRRGPMREPTVGTQVFSANTSNAATGTKITTGFPVDMQITGWRTSAESKPVLDRLRGVSTNATDSGTHLFSNSIAAEVVGGPFSRYWDNTGFQVPAYWSNTSTVFWNFRRAPGFFDVVAYTGTSAARTINHNLGVAPELMIVKKRSSATNSNWPVYAGDGTKYLLLDAVSPLQSNNALWSDTNATASNFTVGASVFTNESSQTHIAYLFATLAGISKVGSYTGNGSSQTINCAFTTGARFVLIKRTDSTGDWYVWDTARGIIAGNDPHFSLNTTAAEVTSNDTIDPDSTGFIVNQVAATNVNVNAATYIYLAIA